MSSQAVATPTRGLPDFTSWPNDLDREGSDSNREDEVSPRRSHSPAGARWSEIMDLQQRNQAVGNLLAALVPISPTQPLSQTATAPATTDIVPAPNQTGDVPDHGSDETATILNRREFDTDADTSLLPRLSFEPHDHFLDTSALPPLPLPLAMDLDQSPLGPLPSAGDPGTAHEDESPPPAASQMTLSETRQVEAFAKLQFHDGNFYMTTYACELGRDAFAYKKAIAEEEERKAGQKRPRSSSGRRSGQSPSVPRPGDSQVQGSVVSQAGGFGGVDEPAAPAAGKQDDEHLLHSQSSGRSGGSIVRPQEVLYNPPPAPFDYHRTAELQAQAEQSDAQDPDNEQPAPVTGDHLPDPNRCVLIPIHATRNENKSDVECHKNISRRHVRIEWSERRESFQMQVLGRNGAFLDGAYLSRGQIRKIRDGSKIQIREVELTFKLPVEPAMESASDESVGEDADQSPVPARSTSPTSDEQDRSVSPPRPGKGKTKIILKTSEQPPPPPPTPSPVLGPDGQPLPLKRRGPGRPPKDGIMSTRERKEREKAAKLAEAKAANGGQTPPPMARGGKPTKPMVKEEEAVVEAKQEKRKYKKRKREGEDGDVVQSIEVGESDKTAEPEKPPPTKKARSKSPSPKYPSAESLTAEQLARPTEPYSRLIYDILLDLYPKALPLKQIYRALKTKFPWFVHRVDSEGWQSSVRHNLNQEWSKLFAKGEKEGKGFAWRAIPGALQPQSERRRAAQQASASKPKPAAAPRQNMPQGPPQTLNWQNSTPHPQNGILPHGAHPPSFGQGPNGSIPPPPNGTPWPPQVGMPSASPYPNTKGPSHISSGQGQPPFFPSAQTGHLLQHPPPPPGITHPSSQGPYRPASAASTPVPAPMPTSTSASRNMPCTLDGLITIKTFENNMLKSVHPLNLERWHRIFASARHRLLHGQPESLMPGGACGEEDTIMDHMRDFIQRFRNPNFVGFSALGTGSPGPISK